MRNSKQQLQRETAERAFREALQPVPGDWRLDPTRGGGALWDVGCYGVSTARLFAAAEPEAAEAVAHFGPTGVDLSLAATLHFPGDVLALVDCSFEQPFRCSYEIVGTNGRIEVPDAYLPPDRPLAYHHGAGGVAEWTFPGKNQYAAMVDAFLIWSSLIVIVYGLAYAVGTWRAWSSLKQAS